jgi:undecaprenyl-diphosphatase
MAAGILRRGIEGAAGHLPPKARDIVLRLTRTDSLVLVRLLLLMAATWIFLLVASEVKEGQTRRIDEAILRGLRTDADPSVPIGPSWLLPAMRDITSLGSATVLGIFTLAVAGYAIVRRQYHAAWLVLGATAGGALLMSALKNVFERPRPTIVPHLVTVSSLSFPSGHAMSSAIVYLTLGALLARLVQTRMVKLYCVGVGLCLSFLVGASRVFLGVHYPTDVLAGWTAGLCWALICWMVASLLQRQGAVEPPK